MKPKPNFRPNKAASISTTSPIKKARHKKKKAKQALAGTSNTIQSHQNPIPPQPMRSDTPSAPPFSADSTAERAAAKHAVSDLPDHDDPDHPRERSIQWCKKYSRSVRVPFGGSWILSLTDNNNNLDDAHSSSRTEKTAELTHVAVHGLCPFHIVTTSNPDGSVECGGCIEHCHEANPPEDASPPPSATHTPLLDYRLVTQPIPMDVLLRSRELSQRSLFFFNDPKFGQMYPNALANSLNTRQLPERFRLTKPPVMYFSNPVCHRTLQHLSLESEYQLDTILSFSIDEWTNVIGNDSNVKIFVRGSRVPIPSDPRFRAKSPPMAMSLAFATEFQTEMFEWFLANESGACYLDAAFSFDKDGFQLWSLFYERNGQTVPFSFLVTTAVDIRLIRRWLEALLALRELPPKTLYVSSMTLCDSLQHILGTWEVRLGKYCVAQELRAHILRPKQSQVIDDHIKRAVANFRHDYQGSIEVIRNNKTLTGRLAHIFDHFDQWNPETAEEFRMFDQSLDACCRWRYLLWSTMLGRPSNSRIDAIFFYLCRHILPGIEQIVRAFPPTASSRAAPFDMDSLEFGNVQRHELLRGISLTKLSDSVLCLAPERNLLKFIVDLDYNVCFCEKFGEKGLCEHLIYCSPDRIHQPEVIQLLATIPIA
ncbi:hypothetical protein GGI15_000777 [Coemansia interrupta]|uniref:Uncharacterized protein n=1 Tax=Coemansia interrupta TaxID=1126814 RepID=A0A9W8LM08_9FUNG|nr:hypothetical protein GGI15_000777 [Coemansia interrupta]